MGSMAFGDPKRLTPLRAQFTSVAFSPDGERIAFACVRRRRCAIYVMDRDGSNPTLVAGQDNAIDDSYYDLQFTPDGTQLVCSVSEEDGEFHDLCLIDLAAKTQRRLTHTRKAMSPSLSPDGQHVIFEGWEGGVADLFRISINNGQVTRLTKTERLPEATYPYLPGNIHCRYSPDGTTVAFASSVYDGQLDRPLQIFTMRPDGSERIRLTDTPHHSDHPLWHPNGNQIAYTVHADLDEGIERTLWKYRRNLHLVDTSDRTVRRLEGSISVNHLGSFHPDGRYLAYYSSCEERFGEGWRNWDIHVLDVETGKVLVVTDNDAYDTDPVFSPDGKMLVFVSECASSEESDKQDEGKGRVLSHRDNSDLHSVAVTETG